MAANERDPLTFEEREGLRRLVSQRRRELLPPDDGIDMEAALQHRVERIADKAAGRLGGLKTQELRRGEIKADVEPAAALTVEPKSAQVSGSPRKPWVDRKIPPRQPRRQVDALAVAERLDTLVEEGTLTARESEILGLVARGFENEWISAVLTITPATVAAHIRNILEKLGANNRTHAVGLVLGSRIVEMDDSAVG